MRTGGDATMDEEMTTVPVRTHKVTTLHSDYQTMEVRPVKPVEKKWNNE